MKVMDVYFENGNRKDKLQILDNQIHYDSKDYSIYRYGVSAKKLQEYGANSTTNRDTILNVITKGYGKILKIEEYEIQF